MDDLISRQAAIRFIRDKVSLSLFMKRSVDKADKACMELCEMLDKDLPSAERHGRWIPVTERLPEAYGRYLVTLEDEDYISVMPLYYGRINRIDTFYDSDSEYGDIEYCGVIAWMPLPTPYKGGEEE